MSDKLQLVDHDSPYETQDPLGPSVNDGES